MVGFFLNIWLKVIAIPFKIAGKYIRSQKVIGSRDTGFTLFVSACIFFSSCNKKCSQTQGKKDDQNEDRIFHSKDLIDISEGKNAKDDGYFFRDVIETEE